MATHDELLAKQVAEHGPCSGLYRGDPCRQPAAEGTNWCARHIRQRRDAGLKL